MWRGFNNLLEVGHDDKSPIEVQSCLKMPEIQIRQRDILERSRAAEHMKLHVTRL
jgi:hypothetical protein